MARPVTAHSSVMARQITGRRVNLEIAECLSAPNRNNNKMVENTKQSPVGNLSSIVD